MPAPLPERDLELLSAYLDNQLPAAEKTRLERRLAAEPELGEALGGLRATVHALRSLPPVRVPRTFTLDPKLYRAPRLNAPLGRSQGMLQWATALSTLLFVVVVAGDFLTRAALVAAPGAALAPASAERMAAETAVATAAAAGGQADNLLPTEAPAVAEAPATETALSTAAPPESAGAGGGRGGAAESTAAPAQMLAAPTSEEAGTPAAEVAVAAQAQATSAALPTDTAVAKTSPAETPTVAASETPVVVARAESAEATQVLAPPAPELPVPPPFNWLRLIEVVLGLLALGLGLAALRRRKRAG